MSKMRFLMVGGISAKTGQGFDALEELLQEGGFGMEHTLGPSSSRGGYQIEPLHRWGEDRFVYVQQSCQTVSRCGDRVTSLI
jgi:hypothetical protein